MGCCASQNNTVTTKKGRLGFPQSDQNSKKQDEKRALKEAKEAIEELQKKKQGKEEKNNSLQNSTALITKAIDPTNYDPRESFKPINIGQIQSQDKLELYFLQSILTNKVQIVIEILDDSNQQSNESRENGFAKGDDSQRALKIGDVSHITLQNLKKRNLQVKIETKHKNYEEGTQLWNPILFMIAKNQLYPLELLFQGPALHRLHLQGIFSKPQCPEKDQPRKAYTFLKRVKKQSFALKLAIYNKNTAMLKFLLNGDAEGTSSAQKQVSTNSDLQNQSQLNESEGAGIIAQVWNTGHIVVAISKIIEMKWSQGLRKIFQFRRVKQIFMSLNDPASFLNFAFQILDAFNLDMEQIKDQKLFKVLTESLLDPPYHFLRLIFLILSNASKKDLSHQIKKIERDCFPFLKSELQQIFKIIDPNGIHASLIAELSSNHAASKDNLSDEQITQQLFNIRDTVTRFKLAHEEDGSDEEQTDKILDEIDDLYPYTYKRIALKKKNLAHMSQPLALQLFGSGSMTLLKYLFSSASDCNLLSQIYSVMPINIGEDPDDLGEENLMRFSQNFHQFEMQRHTNQHGGYSHGHDGNDLLREEYQNHHHMNNQFMLTYANLAPFLLLLQLQNLQHFTSLFTHLISLLSLFDICGLILLIIQTPDLPLGSQLHLLTTVLSHPQTLSLFNTSLQIDRYFFLLTLSTLTLPQHIQSLSPPPSPTSTSPSPPTAPSIPAHLLALGRKESAVAEISRAVVEAGPHIKENLAKFRESWSIEDGKRDALRRKYFGPIVRTHIKMKMEASEERERFEEGDGGGGEGQRRFPWRSPDQRTYVVRDWFEKEPDSRQKGPKIEVNQIELNLSDINAEEDQSDESNDGIDPTLRIEEIDDKDSRNDGDGAIPKSDTYHTNLLAQMRKQLLSDNSSPSKSNPDNIRDSFKGIDLNMNNLVQMQDINKRNDPVGTASHALKSADSFKTEAKILQELSSKETPTLQGSNDMPFDMVNEAKPEQNQLEYTQSSDKLSMTDSEIERAFQELEYVKIQSEVEIAYAELISSIQSDKVKIEDIREVIQGYGISAFEWELSHQIKPDQKNDNEIKGKKVKAFFDKERVNLSRFHRWSALHLATYHNQPKVVEMFLKPTGMFARHLHSIHLYEPPETNQHLHVGSFGRKSNFVLKLLVHSQNPALLSSILKNLRHFLTLDDIADLIDTLTQDTEQVLGQQPWIPGIELVLRSEHVHRAYQNYPTQHKLRFIQSVLEGTKKNRLNNSTKMNAEIFTLGSQDSVGLLQKQDRLLKVLVQEVGRDPYVSMAFLSYPHLFTRFHQLPEAHRLLTEFDLIALQISSKSKVQAFCKSVKQSIEQKMVTKGQQQILQKISDDFGKIEAKMTKTTDYFKKKTAELVDIIANDDLEAFTKHFQSLQSQLKSLKKISDVTQGRCQLKQLQNKLNLSSYTSYQLDLSEMPKDFTEDLKYFPQDEEIRDLLLGPTFSDSLGRAANSDGSVDREVTLAQIAAHLQRAPLYTHSWNPLLFAILHKAHKIIEYIIEQTKSADSHWHLPTLLQISCYSRSSNERNSEEQEDISENDESGVEEQGGDQFLAERQELAPIILCILKNDVHTFELLWNDRRLWSQHIHLILVCNFILETDDLPLTRAFLTSEKTKCLFNAMSLTEKQKFISFIVYCFKSKFDGESKAARLMSYEMGSGEDDDQEQKEEVSGGKAASSPTTQSNQSTQNQIARAQFNDLLHNDFLTHPPFSIVHLTEHLLPLNLSTNLTDFTKMVEDLRESEQGIAVLSGALDNLNVKSGSNSPNECQSDSDDDEEGAFLRLKWQLVGSNVIWSKKLYTLLQEMQECNPELFQEIRALQVLYSDVLGPFIVSDDDE